MTSDPTLYQRFNIIITREHGSTGEMSNLQTSHVPSISSGENKHVCHYNILRSSIQLFTVKNIFHPNSTLSNLTDSIGMKEDSFSTIELSAAGGLRTNRHQI